MLEKVHQDPEFVAKAVQRARSERQARSRIKDTVWLMFLLLGRSKVVLNTPYFLDNHGLKPGTRKKRRCKSGRGFYPVLEALGIQNGVSPASRSEIALYTIQAAIYEEAVMLLKRRDLDVDVSTLKRLAVITSKKDTALRDAALAAALKIPIRPDGPLANKRVRVSLDGGRVRNRKYKKGRRPKKGGRRFEAPWREPRILVIDVLDDTGKTGKFSLPLYDVLIQDADAIFSLMIGYLRLLGAPRASEFIFIADGADWIWNRVKRLQTDAGIPEEIMIEAVDFYHACEHLSEAVELCTSMSRKKREKLFQDLRHVLWHEKNGAKIVMVRLWKINHQKKKGEALSYFINHSGRMKYAWLKERHLPIGSGQVESAVRRVINLRFKAPGSFWTTEIVESLMHLRAVYKAGRWD